MYDGVSCCIRVQFCVAMQHVKEFETKHVIFGKVLEGMDTLRIMLEEGSGEGYTTLPVCCICPLSHLGP